MILFFLSPGKVQFHECPKRISQYRILHNKSRIDLSLHLNIQLSIVLRIERWNVNTVNQPIRHTLRRSFSSMLHGVSSRSMPLSSSSSPVTCSTSTFATSSFFSRSSGVGVADVSCRTFIHFNIFYHYKYLRSFHKLPPKQFLSNTNQKLQIPVCSSHREHQRTPKKDSTIEICSTCANFRIFSDFGNEPNDVGNRDKSGRESVMFPRLVPGKH